MDYEGRVTVRQSKEQAFDQGVEVLEIGCGRCEACRAQKARSWAIRCAHEAQLHTRSTHTGTVSNNSFITLTYANAPDELVKRDFQLFIKRLRKNTQKKIRYFQCGEYGSKQGRSHFHALLFGIDFHEDRIPLHTPGPNTLYGSATLDKAWQNQGYAYIGPLNFATASYVAGYAAKKLRKAQHADSSPLSTWSWKETTVSYPDFIDRPYQKHKILSDTAMRFTPPQQEYITMSRHPGIAHDWIAKYWPEVYPHDEIALNGKTFRPPSYYDDYLRDHFPCKWEQVLQNRRLYAETKGLATPLELLARKANFKSQNSLKIRQRHEDFSNIDHVPSLS